MMINIETTNACNYSCPMCSRNRMTREIGHMPLKLFKRVVDECYELGWPISWLHHFGEPLAYKHLKKSLKYFAEKGVGRGIVSTNGLLLNEEKRKILSRWARTIFIALDTYDFEKYRKWRGRSKEDFLKVQENANEMIKIAPDKTLIQILDKKSTLKGNDYLKNMINFIDADGMVKENKVCNRGFNQLIILWNGDVTYCCYDYDGELVQGNLNDNSLKELWDLRKKIPLNNPLCNRCPMNKERLKNNK